GLQGSRIGRVSGTNYGCGNRADFAAGRQTQQRRQSARLLKQRGAMIMLRFRLRQVEALLHRLAAARRNLKSPASRPLQTHQDVLDLLQEQAEAIRLESYAGPLDKARAIGYLAGIARRTIETGKVAERITMLEAVLKTRK